MVRKLKKPTTDWRTLPQKPMEEWIAESLISRLVLEYHHKTNKWPKKIDLSTLKVDGDILTVDLK